jgi:hypothetical protein
MQSPLKRKEISAPFSQQQSHNQCIEHSAEKASQPNNAGGRMTIQTKRSCQYSTQTITCERDDAVQRRGLQGRAKVGRRNGTDRREVDKTTLICETLGRSCVGWGLQRLQFTCTGTLHRFVCFRVCAFSCSIVYWAGAEYQRSKHLESCSVPNADTRQQPAQSVRPLHNSMSVRVRQRVNSQNNQNIPLCQRQGGRRR